MYRYMVSVVCGILISMGSFGQDAGMEGILQQISQNNRQLKAYQSFIASQNVGNKFENNLPDPQASVYYLPFGEHDTDNYYEYQISQQFEFPTFYAARSKRIDKQQELLELEYKSIRQEVIFRCTPSLLIVFGLLTEDTKGTAVGGMSLLFWTV